MIDQARVRHPSTSRRGIGTSILVIVLLVLAGASPATSLSSSVADQDMIPVLAGQVSGNTTDAAVQLLASPRHTDPDAKPGDTLDLTPIMLKSPDELGYFALYARDLPVGTQLPLNATVVVFADERVHTYDIVLGEPVVEATGGVLAATLEITLGTTDATFRHGDRRIDEGTLNGGVTVTAADVLGTGGAVPLAVAAASHDVGVAIPLVEHTLPGAQVAATRFTEILTAAKRQNVALATISREFVSNIGDFRTILQTTGTNSSYVSYEYYYNENNTSGDTFEVGIGHSQSGAKGSFTAGGRVTESGSITGEFLPRTAIGKYHMYGDVKYAKYRLRDIATNVVYSYETRPRWVTGAFWRSGKMSNTYPTYCTQLGSGVGVTRTTGSTTHWSNGVSVEGWGANLQVLQTMEGGSTHRIRFENTGSNTRYACAERTTIGNTSARTGIIVGDWTNR